MADIRVVLSLDEASDRPNHDTIWGYIDPHAPITAAAIGVAACDQHRSFSDSINITPEIPEIGLKKFVTDSVEILTRMFPYVHNHPINFIIPVLAATKLGGNRRFFKKKPLVAITHEERVFSGGIRVSFDLIIKAISEKGIVWLAPHTECVVAGLARSSMYTPISYGKVGWNSQQAFLAQVRTWLTCLKHSEPIQGEHITRLLHNMQFIWRFSESLAANLYMVCSAHDKRAKIVSRDHTAQVAPLVRIKSHSLDRLSMLRKFALWSDVANQNLSTLLALEEQLGPDDPRVVAIVDKQLSIYNRAEWKKKQQREAAVKLQEDSIIRKIVTEKFGNKHPRLTGTALLNVLTSQEKQLVLIEKKKFDERSAATKCPHRKALIMLARASGQREIAKALAVIKEFTGANNATWIHCNKCKGRLLCSHRLLFEEMSAKQAKQDDIRVALQPYIINYNKSHYCKVCGEILSFDDFVDLTKTQSASDLQDDEIRGKIIVEVYGLLRFLRFTVVVDVKAFVYAVCDAIYPLVQETERQIGKSRMSTIEESDAKSKVFISIYAFAYILVLILRKNSIVHLRSVVDKEPAKLVISAVNSVLSFKNILINRVKGLTPNVIKAKMIDAYKILSGSVEISSEDLASVRSSKFNLACDPIYRTIVRAWRLGPGAHSKKYDDGYNAENLHLAKDLLDIKQNTDLIKKGYDGVRCVALKDSEFTRAYQFLVEIAQLNYHWLYDDVGTADTIVMRRSEFYDSLLAHRAKLEEFVAKKRQWLEIMRGPLSWNYARGRRSILRVIKLGYTYDKKGKLHNWRLDTCTICGVSRKDAENVPEKDLLETIYKNDKMDDLFLYFENRCPEAVYHKFTSTSTGSYCELCLLHKISRDEFYAKYVALFDKSRQQAPIVQETRLAPYVSEPMTFTFDFSAIISFCKKTGVNHYQIMALGASEKATNAQILDGSYTPAEIFERLNTRVFIIASYIRTAACVYNQVKNYFFIQKPPEDITKFIETAQITKDVVAKYPAIKNNFLAESRRAMMQLKPRQLIEFSIMFFCDFISKIWDVSRVIAQYILERVFRAEKLASKHGTFNKSLVFGVSDATETDMDEGAEVVEITSADVEAPDDPFGIDAFDVEDEGDQDDGGIKLKFGDESGVD